MKFIVKETVGQEYYFSVDAENADEAIRKVKLGEAPPAVSTKEASPKYEARRA